MDVSAWMGWKMYPLVIWHSYGKSPCFMGKLTISMAIFHSYVKLLEGSWCSFTLICVNVLWSTWKIIETLYTCFVLKICAFHLTAVRAICGKPTSRNTWTAWRFVPWAMFYAASWVATRRPRFWKRGKRIVIARSWRISKSPGVLNQQKALSLFHVRWCNM